MPEITVTSSTSTSAADQILITAGASSNSGGVTVTTSDQSPESEQEDAINAVYAYVQAMRSLGRTTISTVDIEKALRLRRQTVRHALMMLRDRGVRLINER